MSLRTKKETILRLKRWIIALGMLHYTQLISLRHVAIVPTSKQLFMY